MCSLPLNPVVLAWPGWLFGVCISASTAPCKAQPELLAGQSPCHTTAMCACWKLFCLELPFLGQKASHFVPFSGMTNGQRLENAFQPLPRLLGRSVESKLVWKLLGAAQSRAGMGFSIGVRCRMWVLLGWPTNLFFLGWPLHL